MVQEALSPVEAFQASARSLKPSLMVQVYLIASIAYHDYAVSLISDAEFDRVVRTLRDHWDEIDHPHKKHVDRASLEEMSGFALVEIYLPKMVQGSLRLLLADYHKGGRK